MKYKEDLILNSFKNLKLPRNKLNKKCTRPKNCKTLREIKNPNKCRDIPCLWKLDTVKRSVLPKMNKSSTNSNNVNHICNFKTSSSYIKKVKGSRRN